MKRLRRHPGRRSPKTQSARLQALVRLNQRISSSLDGDQLLLTIAKAAAELMDAPSVSFWTVDEAAETLRLAAFSDGRLAKDFPFRTVRFDQGSLGWVAKHRQTLEVPDVHADTRFHLRWWSAHKLKSFLGVPVVSGESLLAVLSLNGRTPFRLDPEERNLLDMFVAQAAAAIRNARAFAESTARQRAAEALAEVGREILGELNLDRLLHIIIVQATRVFEADGAIHLVGPDGTLAPRAWSQAWDRRDLQVPSGQGVVGRCAETGEGIVVNDYETWAQAAPQFVAGGMTRAMGHALTVHNRLLGVIAMSRAGRDARPFDRDEFAVLGSFANHAAIALENAQLFAREKAARAAAEASERALRESEARYRGLVEGSLQGVYIHEDSVIRFASAALARIFGYESQEELIGAHSTRLMAPHEVPRLMGYAAARLRGEPVPSRYEYEGVRRDGTRIWVEATAAVVPWEEKRGILVLVVDITERKRLEDELRQAQKMEAVGRLAGGVAHDFNNLLTVIIGRAHLALERVGPENPLRRDIELIQKTAQRAATVTQQLLAFSRKQVLQPKVLDLNMIVKGMEAMLHQLIGEHIRLATVSGDGLESVRADPSQIEQVIMNLALNARDAMPEGGTLTIETANVTLDDRWVRRHRGSRPGRFVRLAVIDTGAGMDETALAHVFEPFFTTKETGKGTGLGLAMVYGIIKQSDGYIAVESAPGRGTSFEIYLPRFAEAGEAAGRLSGEEEIARGLETILLVEDEGDVREMARDILSRVGYRVVEAATAGDAERLCREHAGPIHMLLTDVIMPQMSGRDLASRLTGSRPGMRVLYMSGYTDDAISRHGVLDPGIAFLPKPFNPAVLARKVREVLDAAP